VPTGYTPIYKLMKGDLDITNHFNDRVTSIQVELNSGDGEGDKLQIKLDDRDWAIAKPGLGAVIELWLGYEEVGYSFMGSFEMNDLAFIGPPRAIQLTGLSTGMRSVMKAPAIANYANKSLGSILGSIAGSAGIGMSISPELAGKMIPFKNQVTSNLHMIHELERIYGAVAKIANGRLMFVPRDSTTTASGISMPTLVLQPEHFGTWNCSYNSRNQYGSVRAAWRDKSDMVRKWVNTATGEAGGETSSDASSGQATETFTIGTIFNSMQEAQAAIQSMQEALKRSEGRATFELAKGDPWIKDQMTLLVENMRDGINGSWTINKAVHTYVKSTGIKSTLECKAPGDGANFSNRQEENAFLKPEAGELIGEVLKDGSYWGFPDFQW
jgi:phage protein D